MHTIKINKAQELSCDSPVGIDSPFERPDNHVQFTATHPNRAISTVPPLMHLSWQGINVHVEQKRQSWSHCFHNTSDSKNFNPISILNNVHGVARPGKLLAIMGASGAGKTCLLNVLAHRNLSNINVQGTVRVNQQPVTKYFMQTTCAYVQQDDCFIGSLTVKEHLLFNAVLRMGDGYRTKKQLKKVHEVINDLGLNECAHCIIGTKTVKGISGGEKKRVAFASEILTSPPILFCDEPTSGLDSFLALQVINVLKKLATVKSMTIVFTIHQPSSQIFELLDSIYVMAEGRTAFHGSRWEATEFWNGIGRPLPRNFNPADHYISSLANESGGQRNTTITDICNAYDESEYGSKLRATVEHEIITWNDNVNGFKQELLGNAKPRVSTSCINQTRALYWRNNMTILREPTLLKVQIVQSIVIAILIGVIYLSNSYTQEKVQNINGSLYQMVINMAFMFQFAVVNHFCSETHTFFREYGSGLYSVGSYFIAKNLAELPNFTVSATLFAGILYWMSRLIPLWTTFLFYLLVAVLVQNTAISIGYAVSCIFGSVSTAVAVLPIFVVPMMAFGGFFINQNSLPWFFYPFKYLSYFSYAFESLVVNEWSHVDEIFGCTQPNAGNCYKNGTDIITMLSFSARNMWSNVIIIAAMIVIIRSIAFIGLYTRAKLRK